MRPSRYPDLVDYDTEEDDDEGPSNGLRQRGTVRAGNDTTMRDSPDYGVGATMNGEVTDDPESLVLPPPIDLRRWSTARSEVDTTMRNSPSYSLNTSGTIEGVTGFRDSQTIASPPPYDLGLDYLTEEDEVPGNSPRRRSATANDATIAADTETELDTTMHDATIATTTAARPITTPSPSPNTAANLDLSILGAQERYDAYEDLFKRDLPISQIDFPLQTHAFPELKDEIIEAYLDFTTFVFTILTNYDAACERFYTDEKGYNVARHADCGKILLSPKQRIYLQELNVPDNIAFKNVRLDICSHMNKLAEVTLEVRPGSSASEIVHIDSFVNQMAKTDSSALEIFIDNTAHHIADAEHDMTSGKVGFDLNDIEAVAKLFVMQQSKAAKEAAKRKYSNNGTWEEYDKANANRGYAEHLTCYSERTGGYSYSNTTWSSRNSGPLFGSRIRW
ncbi:hypothetical protein LTR27_012400 [Elasticomyces elasticus]|nr:hypothetical protein LTR27_012400 [Elasticomyces elasticus]